MDEDRIRQIVREEIISWHLFRADLIPDHPAHAQFEQAAAEARRKQEEPTHA